MLRIRFICFRLILASHRLFLFNAYSQKEWLV